MRLRYLAICVCGLFLIGTSAFAASAKKASSSAKSTAQGVDKIIAGPVASVNAEKKEIAVERNGNLYPIFIDGSTQIVGKNNPITLEKIKAGDLVSISYHKASDGRRIALNIINKSFVTPKPSLQSKAEPKKEPAAATKAEVKAEPKAESAVTPKVEVKAEPKKEPAAAPKAEIKTEPKKEPVAAQPAKIPN